MQKSCSGSAGALSTLACSKSQESSSWLVEGAKVKRIAGDSQQNPLQTGMATSGCRHGI